MMKNKKNFKFKKLLFTMVNTMENATIVICKFLTNYNTHLTAII